MTERRAVVAYGLEGRGGSGRIRVRQEGKGGGIQGEMRKLRGVTDIVIISIVVMVS